MINRKFRAFSKRLTAFLLSGCMIASLAACGAPEESLPSDSVPSQTISSEVFSSESQAEPVVPDPEPTKTKVAVSDFYEYANAEWFAESPLDSQHAGVAKTDAMTEAMWDELIDFLDNADPASYSQDDPLGKIVLFYNQLAKDETAGQAGMEAMKAVMDKFESAKTLKDFYTLMLDKKMFVLNPLFNTYYSESTRGEEILSLTCTPLQEIYAYYLDEENEYLSEQYSKCLVHLGYSEEKAASICANAYALNNKIRNLHLFVGESDYYFCDRNYFAENPCNVPFLDIFDSHGFHYEKDLYHDGELGFFASVEYMQFINETFVKENLQQIKDLCVVNTLIKFMDMGDDYLYLIGANGILRCFGIAEDQLYKEGDDYKREHRCLEALLSVDSENLAAYYMENHVDKATVQRTDDFLLEIQNNFCEMLKEIDWLDMRVRERLAVKAKKLVVENGCYSSYNHLEDVTVGDNAVDTALAMMVSRYDYGRDHFCGQKNVNVSKINLASFNAAYFPDINTMVINGPLYSFEEVTGDSSFEAWLGSLGAIMAHELGHAYDPYNIEKSKDYSGEYEELLNEEQRGYYMESVNKLSSGLKGLKTQSGKFYTSSMFWNESFADLLGLKVCMRILSKLDNPDYDTFFRYYAYAYADQVTPEMENYLLANDRHLRGRERVNFSLGQFREFYDTYDVDTFGGYYIFPDNRVDIFTIKK